jgi:hypothetical protein
MDIDESIFKEADENVKQDLINQFVATARVLYAEDNISDISDKIITKFLTSRQGHIGVLHYSHTERIRSPSRDFRVETEF